MPGSTPKKAAAGGTRGEKRSESPKKPSTPAKSQSSAAAGDKKASKSTGADIRNFFGGPSQGSSSGSKPVARKSAAGTGKQPISIDDSDSDIGDAAKPKPRAAGVKTTTGSTQSKHFSGSGSGSKQPIVLDSDEDEDKDTKDRSRSTAKSSSKSNGTTPSKTKGGSSSMTAVKRKSSARDESDEDAQKSRPAAKRASLGGGRAKKVNYLETSDEEEEEEKVDVKSKSKAAGNDKASKTSAGASAHKGKKKAPSPMDVNSSSDDSSGSDDYKAPDDDDEDDDEGHAHDQDDDDDEDDAAMDEDEDEDDRRPKKGKSRTKTTSSATGSKKATPAQKSATSAGAAAKPASKQSTPKKAKPPASKPAQAVKDDPEPAAKPKPANNWRAAMAARSAGPSNPGSKEIPEGAPGCLEGLTFVFTGELESLSREDAVELVKRFSGKVTTSPSGRTSYVVVGSNAGETKLRVIAAKGLATLTEDGFLDLIRQRGSAGGPELSEKAAKAREKEEQKIQEQAKEMEKREKEEEALRKRKEKVLAGTGVAAKKAVPISAQLWTTKYAPQNLKEICGNKAPVERLGQWLKDWDKNYKSGFKKPGKEGMGMYRAVLISGPPGIGKTTSAHLMAKEAGYNTIELNASDARSKKLVENSTNIDNASLDGFFQGKGVQATSVIGDGVRIDSRTCLIMDEVDGMSAGDRGGVGALNALIKKTRIPLILICNDRTLQKMKPLQHTTFNMTFRRPGPNEVRSRIMSILYKEKLKIPPKVVDELVKGANSDIRQVLNMLSTFKLSRSEMDFDQGKELLKVNEKNQILTPFTIIDKLCNPYSFSRPTKDTLNEKSELYFHDFSFVPLFMQEHYLKTNPSVLNGMTNEKEKNIKHLELVSKASDWISDGDLVDRMIHGSEQHWSLLPFHAITSTVAPASQIYGGMRQTGGGYGGGGGGWGPSFPQWLGQNSKQGKLQRQLTDIQIRMRLRVSGSKQEIREQYMPMLASKIVQPLVSRGSDAVQETIEYMDEYFLGKEDWDAFVELGVGENKGDDILKKIPTATKTAFTRQYNKADHPIAFHKGDMFAASKKKIADTGPAPDNEDVFEDDEPVPEEDDDVAKGAADNEDEDNDVSKDKLIKEVKKKGKGAAVPAAKGTKGKKK